MDEIEMAKVEGCSADTGRLVAVAKELSGGAEMRALSQVVLTDIR
jgi:hypothetical protein